MAVAQKIKEPENMRNGIVLDKGVVLTEDRIMKNFELYSNQISFFTVYPDLFIDLITPKDSNWSLFPYQRIFLRASMRYRYHYCTAPRAFAKSFLSIMVLMLRCILYPNSQLFVTTGGKI